MITFYKTISASEVKTTYLNLTDDKKQTHGRHFPPPRTELCIIDENGQEFSATKHGNNQLWSNIKQWFQQKNIQPGTQVKITYDPNEKLHDKPVVHIEIQQVGQAQFTQIYPEVTGEDDNSQFAHEISLEFEKQLENFLTDNLATIGSDLTLYIDEQGNLGKQYVTDAGVIDLLCQDSQGDFLVIELKKKRTSDYVVGQILRYMGWVKENLCNNNQKIKGLIITPELDEKLEYAASMVPDVDVKYYRIKLEFVTKDDLKENE